MRRGRLITSDSENRRISASCRLTLSIPGEQVDLWLTGTPWVGRQLDDLTKDEYEPVGRLLEEKVAEEFAHILEYANNDPDVEVDW